MEQNKQRVSLGVKIFGIAVSMLLLMVLVVYLSYTRLSRVNEKVFDLTQYLIPITSSVDLIEIHVLEQEVHFENLLRLYEIEPLNQSYIDRELASFEERSALVDQELTMVIALAQEATQKMTQSQDQTIITRLEPIMEKIEREYQDFHNHATNILSVLAMGQKEEARRLEADLEVEEAHFDQEIEKLRLELANFDENVAELTKAEQQEVLFLNAIIAMIGTILGLVSAFILTGGVVYPVTKLMTAMRQVGQGDLAVQVEVNTRDEIGYLANSFSEMVKELVLKEQIKGTFGKYVDPRVVEDIINQPGGPVTGGEKQNMTVIFSDIEGLDEVEHQFTPEQRVDFTNQYLTLMSNPISAHNGVLDKFIGTMVMAFWGPPFTNEAEHPRLACQAILAQLAQLENIRQLVSQIISPQVDLSNLNLRVGMATGTLVVGNMGSEQSKSYTVLGDTVNTASRLKGACKQYGTTNLITDTTEKMVRGTMACREIDLIGVIGKEEPLRVYELLGFQGNVDQQTLTWRDTFEKSIQAYRQQNWPQALNEFENCRQLKPSDRPTKLYIERIKQLQLNPPGADWDGVWQLTKK